MQNTYKQPIKNEARYSALSEAVGVLTSNRGLSACVRGTYVNDLKHFFIADDSDSAQAKEASRISAETLAEWTRLWESCLGARRVEDLKVCYLAGPEPTNDLEVLISLGVLPSNVWAFESDRDVFASAVEDLCGNPLGAPRLVKMKAESFFASIPIVFDIVYLDCCASLISSSHALRVVADLFRYQRLQSPGVLITNFCEPDFLDKSIRVQYADLLVQRSIVSSISSNVSFDAAFSNSVKACREFQNTDFPGILEGYSDLITQTVISAATVVSPASRASNTEIKKAYVLDRVETTDKLSPEEFLKGRSRESLLCFLSAGKWFTEFAEDHVGPLRMQLVNDLGGAQPQSVGVLESLERLWSIRDTQAMPNCAFGSSVSSLGNAFQFHDKPGANLGVDLSFGQLARPMFPAVHSTKRYRYKARTKTMYLDVIPFDECRYVFDWIPLPPHMREAFDDLERQYVFRFALDGLVKQRMDYCTDYFFSGSVVDGNACGFEKVELPKRIVVG